MARVETLFDVMDFQPLSWADWKKRYRRHIRVSCEPDRVKHTPKVGLSVASSDIWMTWYDKGGWQDGVPRKVSIGTETRLIRIPVLRVKGRLLALDGMHRLTELRPAMVLMDWIEPRVSDLIYFTDMHNTYWRKWSK